MNTRKKSRKPRKPAIQDHISTGSIKLKRGQAAVVIDENGEVLMAYFHPKWNNGIDAVSESVILATGLLMSSKHKRDVPVEGLRALRIALLAHSRTLFKLFSLTHPE